MAEAKLYRDRNLQIIFGVTLMAVLAVSSIAPVFPKIINELGISKQAVGLLITAFTAPGMAMAPFLGVMADRWGRKRILVPSLFLFGITGAACALTSNFTLILVLRIFQGIGGAGLGSINVTLIGDLYSGQQRMAAMGLNASILSIGTASYPFIGGALGLLSWHYPFLLPLVAIPIGIAAMFSLRNPEPESHERFGDYLRGAWSYMKNIKVAGLFAGGVLVFIILYGALMTYLALLLGGEPFHASSLVIGIIISASSVSTALISTQVGRLSRRFSEATLIKAGFTAYALGMALIPLMPSLWFFLVPAAIFGIGQGINMPVIMTMVAGLAPMQYRAAFMSINATMLRLGQTVGPPLMGLIYIYLEFGGVFYAAAILAGTVPVTITVFSRLTARGTKEEIGAAP